jgi:NTE family protein
MTVVPSALEDDTPSGSPKSYALGLCLSGGGYRAMLFHAGALARLNEAGLLSGIELVSSVSGGSITAGVLAAAWPDLDFQNGVATNFEQRVLNRIVSFSQKFVDAPAALKGIIKPWSSAPKEVARAYRRHLFDDRNLSALTSVPWFIFCASNLSTGSLFRMSNRYLADYRIGVARLRAPADPKGRDLSLADAVACSSAFPPFLSPLRLDLSQFDWVNEKLDDEVGSPTKARRAVLTDGGVYDNHGIEPALKRCRTVFVSDGGAPWRQSESGFWTWYSQLKRVIDTTDNQVRALRRRDLIGNFKAARLAGENGVDVEADPSLTKGCYWSIAPGEKVLKAAPQLSQFLNQCARKPMSLPTVLHFLGEAETEAAVNWGYLVTDQALRAHYDAALPACAGLPLAPGAVQPTRAARLSRAAMKVLGY